MQQFRYTLGVPGSALWLSLDIRAKHAQEAEEIACGLFEEGSTVLMSETDEEVGISMMCHVRHEVIHTLRPVHVQIS